MKLFLLTIFLTTAICNYGQELEWYQETWSTARNLVVSEEGLVTVAGTYNHSEATVNGVTLNTSGVGTYKFDPFVARYSTEGSLLWVQTGWTTGYGFQELNDVATDSDNSAIVTGYFADGILFGGETLVPDGFRDIFVAKYNSIGQHLWSKKIGGPGSDFAYHVKTDTANNIYISGNYAGTINIDGQVFIGSTTMANQAIIKLDSNGNLIWMHTVNSTGLQDFDVSPGGLVTIAGNVQNYLVIDGQSFPVVSGNINQYISRLTASGTTDWIKYIDSPNNQHIYDVILDANNNAYMCCSWNGPTTIDGISYNISNDSEIVMKLNSTGQFEWFSEFLGEDTQCYAGLPSLSITNDNVPCLACQETEIITSENFQNFQQFGLTIAKFDAQSGEVFEKQDLWSYRYYGKVSFDAYGAMYSKGGDLTGVQFNGSDIPPAEEGIYIMKLAEEDSINTSAGEIIRMEDGVVAYPNPFYSNFSIQVDLDMYTAYNIEIIDVIGKRVLNIAGEDMGLVQIPIDAKLWAQGMYHVVITTSTKKINFRVVKQ